jgi:hypothetical protein
MIFTNRLRCLLINVCGFIKFQIRVATDCIEQNENIS